MKMFSWEGLAKIGIEVLLLALTVYFLLVFALIAICVIVIFLPIYLLSGGESLKKLVGPC